MIDLWTALEGETPNRKNYLVDGLHLNDKGNQELYRLVVNTIATYYPEYTPELLNLDQPHWSKFLN